MTIFDLVFLAGGLALVLTVVAAAVAAIGGRWRVARRRLTRLGIGLAIYFGALVAVSLGSPGRVVAPGAELCSDDWCISLAGAVRTRAADGDHLDVTFRLASHAARVSQREQHVVAWALDVGGGRHDADVTEGMVPFDVLLGPGESRTASRTYRIPAGTALAGMVIARDGAGWFPRCCIIGDAGSLFHRPTVLRLP